MAPVELSAHMTVRPGCLEGFKRQATECIRITREKDTHTTGSSALQYPRSPNQVVQGVRGQPLHDGVRGGVGADTRGFPSFRG
jgi:hypothetical protein